MRKSKNNALPRLMVASLTILAILAKPHSVQEYPLPKDSAVADPDGILSISSKVILEERIEIACQNLVVASKTHEGEPAPVQVAVAIAEKIDTSAAVDNRDVDGIVETFARQLHDRWGVGYESPMGGTGVLIFLDVYDRVVYISRGGALDRILTDSRVDDVIHDMISPMRQAKYDTGILQAIERIIDLVEKGEPTFWEKVLNLFRPENFIVTFWIFLVFNGFFQAWKQRREQRAYVQVASQLSELDRAQAEALQGNYHPQTSCPICLESFQSETVGTDGQPIKLLRCGHVFDDSCWCEWVSSGRGDVTKCPVCRMDIGPALSDPPTSERSAELVPTEAPTADANVEWSPDGTRQQESETLVEQQLLNERGGAQIDRRNERALALFQQERNFRLLRLATMYPRYMTPDQVTRFGSVTYNGQMVRDPSFVNRNPASNLHHQSTGRNRGIGGSSRYGGGSGGFSHGFGGGTSSGGRSGRF